MLFVVVTNYCQNFKKIIKTFRNRVKSDIYHLMTLFNRTFFVKDELLWAAAWLYKASGETSYLDYVSNNEGWSQAVSEFSWDNKFAGAQTLLAKVYLKMLL